MIFKITVKYKYHPSDHFGLPDHSKEYDGYETIYAPPPITDSEIKRTVIQVTNKYLILRSISYEIKEIEECDNG